MARLLMTVPPRLGEVLSAGVREPAWLRRVRAYGDAPAFLGADPIGRRLGSGGGTVNVLYDAWLADCAASGPVALEDWLAASQKLIVHAGGQSRRLPAYAALGKAFMPLPAIAGLAPRLPDQVLADFQIPTYLETLAEAGAGAAALVTSGDVWLDFDTTEIPTVSDDIVGIGMPVPHEMAKDFGVFFVERQRQRHSGTARPLAFFRQKPSVGALAALQTEFEIFVDTGMWLLSAAAIGLLFAACGWDSNRQRFATPDGRPASLDLYTDIGPALGCRTDLAAERTDRSEHLASVRSSVIPLEDARFYHLGSSRQLLESMQRIQWRSFTPRRTFEIASQPGEFHAPANDPTWIEGSAAESGIRVDGFNFLTGMPAGAGVTRLGVCRCLTVLPVSSDRYAVQPYHLDDLGRGSAATATICGIPARTWLERRGLAELGDRHDDVFDMPLYPIVPASELTQALVDWFFAANPDESTTRLMTRLPRVSAAQLPAEMDLDRYLDQRRSLLERALIRQLEACVAGHDAAVFAQDGHALAEFCRIDAPGVGEWIVANGASLAAAPERPEHQARAAAVLARLAPEGDRPHWRRTAFEGLEAALLSSGHLVKARPQVVLKEDQIVWARSPVRLDLAGGWTDAPPFCLEAGGTVLNVAILLNGQPPIQVFARPLSEPVLRLRSIDLGSSEEIADFEGLRSFLEPGRSFSLPKAVLTLAGFHPDFVAGPAYRSLRDQLASTGGLEVSTLSAVPKGSGLGTSSILAATLLGAINRACGLEWDEIEIYNRVLGVEQLLTSGGGWQDQAGALFPGLKLVETRPGPDQSPTVRYLPHRLIDDAANGSMLLYYTGLTRVARAILQEIVEDLFAGRASTMRTMEGLRANARRLYGAVQLHDRAGFSRCIARSWRLNKQLDSGTSTAEIEAILAACGDDLVAAKLPGAGGGGFMLMCARDAAAGGRIRQRLEAAPPNARARFVDFAVATSGLEVTVS